MGQRDMSESIWPVIWGGVRGKSSACRGGRGWGLGKPTMDSEHVLTLNRCREPAGFPLLNSARLELAHLIALLRNCVSMGRSVDFSVPQFLHL